MRDPYYTRYQKDQWTTLQAYKNVLGELHKRRNWMLDNKFKADAQRVWGEIADLQQKYDSLADKMIKDREDFSAAMIEVFLISNLAYAKAVEFQDLVKQRTGVGETALAEDVSLMVKAAESIALMIDTVGHDKQAEALSDIIDELEEEYNNKVSPVVKDIISKFRKSNQFKLF